MPASLNMIFKYKLELDRDVARSLQRSRQTYELLIAYDQHTLYLEQTTSAEKAVSRLHTLSCRTILTYMYGISSSRSYDAVTLL